MAWFRRTGTERLICSGAGLGAWDDFVANRRERPTQGRQWPDQDREAELAAGCFVAFRPIGADTWEVEQHGMCETPQGTVYAGTYKR